MDDMNNLLKREQEEMLLAQLSTCVTTRAAHRVQANVYLQRIRDHRLPYRTATANGRPAFAPYALRGEGLSS